LQELFRRAAEEAKSARTKRRAEKYKQWQGAAKRFKGPSKELMARTELRNISKAIDGYRVGIMRDGEMFSQSFVGLSEDSLSAAMKFRDEALKILGDPRDDAVPKNVLQALGCPLPWWGLVATRLDQLTSCRTRMRNE
jgi:hypothetical protein